MDRGNFLDLESYASKEKEAGKELTEGTATFYADSNTPRSRSREYTPAETRKMIEQFLQDTAL